MPVHHVPGYDGLDYLLICYDANGRERREAVGGHDALLRERALVALDGGAITDVFLISHGWKGDVAAAIVQYDNWIAAMAGCAADQEQMRTRRPDFNALLIGLHWPSLPWGDEELSNPSVSFDPSRSPLEQFVEDYAERIADTPAARDALATIVEAALDDIAPASLSAEVAAAYVILDREAGLASAEEGAEPGADREPFDPERAYQNERADVSFGGGGGEGILGVLRQLSFWKMKDRARRFGESGAHSLLTALQEAASKRGDVRFHLMGHSFGCIVMSAMLAGPDNRGQLQRPVDSLFLVQGAMSLWSFCSEIPRRPGRPGYFRSVVADRKVSGPVVVTMSEYDTAVRKYYPLGAGIRRQVSYAPGDLPKYGGLGVFGIRGPGVEIEDRDMAGCDHDYGLRPGIVYNLDAAEYIKKMTGAPGAHNDIAHPEVAHAFWQAAMPL